MMYKPKVFISYANIDSEIAQVVAKKLNENNITVFYDRVAVNFGEDLFSRIRNEISTSDYLVLIMSPDSLNSHWIKSELEYAVQKDLRQRSINLIPFKIGQLILPEFIQDLQLIDGTRDLDKALNKLVDLLTSAPLVKFDDMTPQESELFAHDFLKAYGFRTIKSARFAADFGYDISATFEETDPFGREQTVEWIIEVKAKKSKTDTSALSQFLGALSLRGENTKGLFMTFGQLTTPALEWLELMRKSGKPQIRILDGPEIKKLTLAKSKLMKKYFNKVGDE